MSKDTPIQWADTTCNPTMGCDGCELWNSDRKSCYAGLQHDLYGGLRRGYSPAFGNITYWPGRMAEAARLPNLTGLRRNEKPWLDGWPRLIFISDMGDALSASVPFAWLQAEIIDNVTSSRGCRHIWIWLTKRPKRMAEFSVWLSGRAVVWPNNLWAGTSVTSVATTDRIAPLLNVGNEATIHCLSVEPQLEPLDLRRWLRRLDWVIQGGESGPQARTFDITWTRSMQRDCEAAGTPFFLKQLGARAFCGKNRIRLRHPHGADWSEWPDEVPKVREMPVRWRTKEGREPITAGPTGAT